MSDKEDLLDSLVIDKKLRADVSYKFNKIHFMFALLFLVLIASFYIFSGDASEPKKSKDLKAQKAVVPSSLAAKDDAKLGAPAALNSSCEKFDLSGYIVATRLANLSSSVYGVISEVNSEEGGYVKAGDIVAKLDDLQAQYDYEIAVASLGKAEVDLESLKVQKYLKETELTRFRSLQNNHYISELNLVQQKNEFDIMELNLKAKKFEISRMKLEIKKQEKNLQEHVIRAPFAGIIISLYAKKGEVIAPSAAGGGLTRTGIGSIVDMDSLEIEIEINEKYIQNLKEGLPLTAELYAYSGWSFPARVKKIIPVSDRGKATIRARVEILVKDIRILPGMAVSVHRNQSDKGGC